MGVGHSGMPRMGRKNYSDCCMLKWNYAGNPIENQCPDNKVQGNQPYERERKEESNLKYKNEARTWS